MAEQGEKYTAEEKGQLLANFDLEVSHRTRQFEEWLVDSLENFRIHQGGLISRVPRLVRDITMREFVKYGGDVQECLKGVQKERLGGAAPAIDKSTRKRKWVESQEAEGKAGTSTSSQGETSKGAKSARMMPVATPKKKVPPTPGTTQRSRLPLTKTPVAARTLQRTPSRGPPISPQKPWGSRPIPFPSSHIGRPGSPAKPISPSKVTSHSRVPSSSTFNPAIPSASHPRWPRRDESMLSVNGSPLANPYQFGLGFAGWLRGGPEANEEDSSNDKTDNKRGHQRTNSIIVRTACNATIQSSQSNAPSQQSHSRSNSNSRFVPTRGNRGSSTDNPPTPKDQSSALPSLAAIVAVQTRDGHILEFDPLQTSPEEIDALEGLTDSAKKEAKEDIAKLVMQAVQRWKMT